MHFGLGHALTRMMRPPAVSPTALSPQFGNLTESAASGTVIIDAGAWNFVPSAISNISPAGWLALSGGSLVAGATPANYESAQSATCTLTYDPGGGNVTADVVITIVDMLAPSAPTAPTVVGLSENTIRVTLSSDPASGAAITSRDIRYGTDQISWTTLSGITSPRDITSLASGTIYYVQWRANSAEGNGGWSASGSDETTPAPGLDIGFQLGVDEGSTGDVFVDSATGNDGNAGTSGSPKATIAGGLAILSGGQTLRARGTFREIVSLTAKSGTVSAKTYIKGWGTAKPVITGANQMTGWTQCTIADEPEVGANYAQMYKKTVPLSTFVGSDPEGAIFREDGEPLIFAVGRNPNPLFPDLYDFNDDWRQGTTQVSGGLILGTIDAALTDTLTQAQIEACDVKFHGEDNRNFRTSVASFNTGTKVISYTDQTQTYEGNQYKDSFALLNCLPKMQKGGWGYRVVSTDATIYVWPRTPATIDSSIDYAARGRCIDFGAANHVVVQGVICEMATGSSSSDDGASNVYNYAISAYRTGKNTGLEVRNVLVRDTYRSVIGDYAPLTFRNCDDLVIKQVSVTRAYGQFGMFVNWDSVGNQHSVGLHVDRCYVEKSENSPYRFFGCYDSVVSFCRTYKCGLTAHSNKSNFYILSSTFLWYGCDFEGSSGYLTWQEASGVSIVACNVPVSYKGGTGGGRGIEDQNGAAGTTPADLDGQDGTGYVINNMVHPYGPEVAADNSFKIGGAPTTVTWPNVHNNIFHGANGTNTARITTASHNVTTNGSGFGTNLVSSSATAEYTDYAKGDFSLKAGAAIRTAATTDVSAVITALQARFPQFTEWDKDLIGNPIDWAAPPMGPLASYDSTRERPMMWVDRPIMTGGTVVGDTASLSDGFRVGSPFEPVTYAWFTTDGITDTSTGETGATRATVSGDTGLTVGCNVTSGGDTTRVLALGVATNTYAVDDPVLVASGDKAASAGNNTNTVETGSYAFTNKPIIVAVFSRNSSSAADNTFSLTIGASGRGVGTGTALTAGSISRRSSAQIAWFYLIAPGTGTFTVQATPGASAYGVDVRVFEVDGMATVSAAANVNGTGLTSLNPSKTTVGTQSLVIYGAVHISGAVGGAITTSGATQLLEDTTGTNTSTDVRYAAAFERSPSAGSYDATFTWTGGATASGCAIELAP